MTASKTTEAVQDKIRNHLQSTHGPDASGGASGAKGADAGSGAGAGKKKKNKNRNKDLQQLAFGI